MRQYKLIRMWNLKPNTELRDCIKLIQNKCSYEVLPRITFVFEFGFRYLEIAWIFWEISYFHDRRNIDNNINTSYKKEIEE